MCDAYLTVALRDLVGELEQLLYPGDRRWTLDAVDEVSAGLTAADIPDEVRKGADTGGRAVPLRAVAPQPHRSIGAPGGGGGPRVCRSDQ